MDHRKFVHLEYACPICGDELLRASTLLNHMKLRHQIPLPTRQYSKPPASKVYRYQAFRSPVAVLRHACPCCWEHFPSGDTSSLRQHIIAEHLRDELIDDFHCQVQLEDQGEQEEQEEQSEAEKEGLTVSFEDMSGFYNRLTDLVSSFKHLFMSDTPGNDKNISSGDSEAAVDKHRTGRHASIKS